MLAFLFCLGLFALWAAAGHALLYVLDPTRHRVQRVLLAPPVGMVLTVLPVFLISRAGVPCDRLAPWVTAALALFGAWGVWRARADPTSRSPGAADSSLMRRSRWSSRSSFVRLYWPFAAVLVGAMAMAGRPWFEFGFNWVSFCNDDMANYTLGAQRFLHNGFYDLPAADALTAGTDYSQNFWFMHARDAQRPGCELLIAWAAGTTGLSVHDVYMPLIVAMHAGLVSVAAAAVYRARRRRGAAVAAGAMVAASSLAAFGALYQLIAQVAGLSLLAAATVMLLRPLHAMRPNVAWRYGVAVGILMAGFLIVYPEATPFLGLSFFVYHGLQLARRRRAPWRRLAVVAGVALAAGAVAMQVYFYNALMFLADQFKTGAANPAVQVKLFPFYVIPSGLSTLWNLQQISVLNAEPFMSAGIAAGIGLSLFVIIAGARLAWRGEPAAVMTLVMFALAAQLFAGRAAFGLYKIAMFLQPFMLAVLVMAWWQIARRGWARVAPLLVLGLISAGMQARYVTESRGTGTFAEIADASEIGVSRAFARLVGELRPESVVLDTSNVTLAKFQSTFTKGVPTAMPTHNFWANIQRVDLGNRARRPGVAAWSELLLDGIGARTFDGSFAINGRTAEDRAAPATDRAAPATAPATRPAVNPFLYSTVGLIDGRPSNSQYLVAAGGRLTVLNRFRNGTAKEQPFVVTPMADVRDHLIFKFSELGNPYYGSLADDDKVSLFQMEYDGMIPGGRFVGVGRYLLFEVVNPTPGARLMLDFTATLKADGRNVLPPASVVGTARGPLGTVGRGSARLYGPPVEPQVIGGRAYVLLDLGEYGTLFPFRRTGLMNLWGRDVLYDRRKLVAFARNISMVSDAEHRALRPPRAIPRFENDKVAPELLDPNLEYSGIYETAGWVSDASFYAFDGTGAAAVSARGEVPLIDDESFATVAQLLLDGKVVAEQRLMAGAAFELTAAVTPVTPADGPGTRRRVELRFDRTQPLRPPDNRPVGAKLSFIGFEGPPATAGK